MSAAVSRMASVTRLSSCFLAFTGHLHQNTFINGAFDKDGKGGICREPPRPDPLQRLQRLRADVVSLALGESEQKDRARRRFERHEYTISSRTTLALLATRCLIRCPPRSASIRPRAARNTASQRLASGIVSCRAYR